ncbi:MAG: hypothetical protein JXB38_13040 [Anaerolineales bacterium]|nr:hypothetical protein [Anaerolineales bacterium]
MKFHTLFHSRPSRTVLLLLTLLTIFLAACTDAPTSTITSTPKQPMQITATFTDEASELKNTPTVTKSPTATTLPTLTATPLADTFLQTLPATYDLPAWFSIFEHTVVMTVTDFTETHTRVAFIDANLSEEYNIWVPHTMFSHYFWTTDGESFGFLSRDKGSVYIVDSLTGQASKYEIDDRATECLEDYLSRRGPEYLNMLEKMWVFDTSPEYPDFFCEPGSKAKDYQFELKSKRVFEGETETLIATNTETGHESAEMKVADPENELYALTTSRVVDSPLLVVVQGGPYAPEALEPRWRHDTPGDRILLFDMSSGKLVNTFEGEYVGYPKWSPDHTKILTEKDNRPCVIDAESRGIKCLDIERSQEGYLYADLFMWSKDSEQIYYGQSSDRADVCIYDLPSDDILCPTSALKALEDLNIEYYKISPDEQFFIFLYGYSCSTCDVWGEPSSGIIRRDGTDFYFLGDEGGEPSFPFFSSLTRPQHEK